MSFSGRSIASTNGSTRLASIDIPVCWPLINRYVYEQLPPRVLEKLQELESRHCKTDIEDPTRPAFCRYCQFAFG